MNRHYWKHFATAIAALASTATLLTVLFDFEMIKENWLLGLIGVVVVLGVSLFYACWQTKTKKKIAVSLSSELKFSISEGDLFEKKGIICIPFNEYFDTHVGDGVVDAGSNHGKFIERFYKNRIPDIESKIQAELAKQTPLEVCNRRIQTCPNKKYPLGTCIDVPEGENLYVLFAFTHFDDDDHANISRIEYADVVNKLMDHLTQIADDKPVYMPLFGTKLSRMHRTPHRVLLHLVDTIDFNDTSSIPGGLNIVIESLEDMNVNLTMLEHIVRAGITETE